MSDSDIGLRKKQKKEISFIAIVLSTYLTNTKILKRRNKESAVLRRRPGRSQRYKLPLWGSAAVSSSLKRLLREW